MNWKQTLRSLLPLGAALAWLAVTPAAGAATAQEIINSKCVTCHTKVGDQVNRLQQRKSPEGWLMTVTRMRTMHNAPLSPEEVRTVVKHLADTQGLAPSETQGARFAMERRLNTIEQHKTELFGQMCARCHSGARVELQRRPMAEWEHLVHFHLGQFPTTEYQAGGRDRDWLGIALKEMVPYLAKTYPYESKAWDEWKAQAPVSPVGRWTVAGRWPGKGDYAGVMEVAAGSTADRYTVGFDGQWADGSAMKGSGQALVYTGYEWRADLDIGGMKMRQVMALDGDRASGRIFERDQDESGGELTAARQGAGARVLALQPAHIRAGETATLRIVGTGLLIPHRLTMHEFADQPGVAYAGQLGVDPDYRHFGLGSRLMDAIENRAREMGFHTIMGDTSEGAEYLLKMYAGRGYEVVGYHQWPGKTYRSVVLALRL